MKSIQAKVFDDNNRWNNFFDNKLQELLDEYLEFSTIKGDCTNLPDIRGVVYDTKIKGVPPLLTTANKIKQFFEKFLGEKSIEDKISDLAGHYSLVEYDSFYKEVIFFKKIS